MGFEGFTQFSFIDVFILQHFWNSGEADGGSGIDNA
jgi:hypothetical protein